MGHYQNAEQAWKLSKPFTSYNNQGSFAHRYTEDKLNSDFWVNGNGEKLELSSMDEGYLRNVLHLLYKKRSLLWLGCKNVSLIDEFENEDDFFHRVVRESTLWFALIDALEKLDQSTEFNFDIKKPHGEDV